VAYWLERGALANWTPSRLYFGCPNLEDWQRRGLDLLFAARLSPERSRDFAIAMKGALRCDEPRLNQWYFDRIDQVLRAGEDPAAAFVYWDAMGEADSPGIRRHLRRIMQDTTTPDSYRSLAGGRLFGKFSRDERLQEWLALFETGEMPWEVAVGVTQLMLQQDGTRLLRELEIRVRDRPELADQFAFNGIVESSDRYVGQAARRSLGEALEAGLADSGLRDEQRARLLRKAEFLKAPRS
jgi:hypothetical protein